MFYREAEHLSIRHYHTHESPAPSPYKYTQFLIHGCQAQFSICWHSYPCTIDHKHDYTPVIPVYHLLYWYSNKRWQLLLNKVIKHMSTV